MRLLEGDPDDTWYRRAAHSLVDFGLDSDQPEVFLEDLEESPAERARRAQRRHRLPAGRADERARSADAALAAYAKVDSALALLGASNLPVGRDRGRRRTTSSAVNSCSARSPTRSRLRKRAPLFGGTDFFRVRDLARLGLGRVAHEQYRFDDARYYYYLVPNDSEHIRRRCTRPPPRATKPRTTTARARRSTT